MGVDVDDDDNYNENNDGLSDTRTHGGVLMMVLKMTLDWADVSEHASVSSSAVHGD